MSAISTTIAGSRLTFRIYKDKKNEWRWRLLSNNGKIIGDSAEGYKRKDHCVKMVARIIAATPTVHIG